MSSFELNKLAGAVLLAVLVLMVIGKLGDNLVSTGGGHGGDGHAVTVVAKAPAARAKKKEAPLEPILGQLASADIAAGKKVFAKCKACHTTADGGKDGIGPNLWNIVNANMAARAGFGYSKALAAMGKSWSYSSLNAFLAKPKKYVPGTKMGFGGLKKTKDRANIVAYLRSLSPSPAALPSQADIDAKNAEYDAKK